MIHAPVERLTAEPNAMKTIQQRKTVNIQGIWNYDETGAAHDPFSWGHINGFIAAAPLIEEIRTVDAWNYTKESGNGNATYNQFTLGTDYFLSKRTDVYLEGMLEHASGRNSQGVTAVAAINTLSPSNSNQQTYIRLGIRHKF
jgi:hypothetical protein